MLLKIYNIIYIYYVYIYKLFHLLKVLNRVLNNRTDDAKLYILFQA